MDDAVWHHAVFSKNRDRLLSSAVAQQFFSEVNRQAKRFMGDEHFTVDGTLIQAWASQKSFRSKDGSDDDDGCGVGGLVGERPLYGRRLGQRRCVPL
jgi:hypothetical protein